MYATIKVFSASGNTPVTKRGGQYCDLLVDTKVSCATPDEAKAEAKRLLADTPHAYSAHYDLPEHSNQNTRAGWINKGQLA